MLLVMLRQWLGILFTPRLNFVPATMNTREGFDLRVCQLVDGSALLHVPHAGTPGMFCCEVETALGIHHDKAHVGEYLSWVNAKGWSDWNRSTVTGRKMIYVGDRVILYEKRRLSQWMTWVIKWRMERNEELVRHYRNFSFMSLLNHLWDDIDRRPAGFVERWALRGPEAVEEAWAEAESVYPGLKEKKHSRALFEVLKDH